MQDPILIRNVGSAFEYGFNVQPWIVDQEGKQMIFLFWEVENAFEIHIVCKRDSILESRSLAQEILYFLDVMQAGRLVTNCPIDRPAISNFVTKLGFTEFERDETNIYYEVI